MVQSCATLDAEHKSYPSLKNMSKGTKIYLIGGLGQAQNKKLSVALQASSFKDAKKEDVLLFLGNNLYPSSFSEKKLTSTTSTLGSQINMTKSFKGTVLFIPGNEDWSSGIDGLRAQENMVEKAFGKQSFLPQKGCPIDTYEVSDNIVIITVDSEWYITNWDKHPKINANCTIKTKKKFIAEFKSLVNKNQNKTIVLAMHHPLKSLGNHGGQFRFNPIKAPLNVIRSTSGIRSTDFNHPLYRELSNKITTILQEYKNQVIVVSSHDHNLQYFTHENIPQIISGAGSTLSPVRHYKNDTTTFGYAGLGYAILNIQNNKHQVHFVDANNQTIDSKLIREHHEKADAEMPNFPSELNKFSSIYTKHTAKKSKAYNSFFGHHYRQLYFNKYSYPIANLDSLFSGIKPVKLGGGNQSISLRLEDKNGKEYVMRRLRKSASQFIQVKAFEEDYMKDRLEHTVAKRFLMDFYTTSYPFAALFTGSLSERVGVYHTNPKYYYVPKQKALKTYNDALGDDLYLIEERVAKEFKDQTTFGSADDIVSTDEVIEKITKDEKYKINQNQYIKTRLFDMWLGDWDRHEDQYRWATYKNPDGTVTFAPIPRDRDQAFSKFDGFLTGAATRLIPSLRLMQSFEDDIRNVKNFNQIIYKVDKILINKSSLNDWIKQANYLQENLSNAAIDSAVAAFPNQFKDSHFKAIVSHLKNRKQHIVKWAETYYTAINKNVILQGTNKDDLFEITRLENGLTQVKIKRIKKEHNANDVLFDKTFNPSVTKEIWLYGLDDANIFIIKGHFKSSIKLRLIGGQGTDTYHIKNKKNIKVYDYKSKKNTFEGEQVNTTLTDLYEPNHYDFHKFKHNLQQLLPTVGYNPDDGLVIGTLAVFTKYGYELNPFTQKHTVGTKYYSTTSGYELDYTGEFARIFGKNNLKISARYTTPAFSQNFFGFGNTSENLEDDLDIGFYRTRLEQFNFKAAFVKRGRLGSEFLLSIPYDYISANDNTDCFVATNFSADQLNSKQFLGLETQYRFQNKNNTSFSTLGIALVLVSGWKANLEDSKQNFAYLTSTFQLDYPILKNEVLTLSTLWQSQIISNQNFEFYQASSIGGKNGLRGFRNERFSGRTSYFQNTDLRLNITRFNAGILPAKLGVFSGFDYGRVWQRGENSNLWHTTFGGGLYVNTSGIFTLQISYFSSDDGGRFLFGLNFGF